MGICVLPGCEEWVNAATTAYCCELHKQIHRAEKAEAEVKYHKELMVMHPGMCCGHCAKQIAEAEAQSKRLRGIIVKAYLDMSEAFARNLTNSGGLNTECEADMEMIRTNLYTDCDFVRAALISSRTALAEKEPT